MTALKSLLAAGACLVLAGVASAQSGGTNFSCDFQGSWKDCGFHEQARSAERITAVQAGGRSGVRLLTVPGDSRIAGSGDAERTDLALSTAATDCIEGREHWWAHSILFPDDYVDPPMSSASTWNWATVFDFHNSLPGPGQANFQINAMPRTVIAADRPSGLNFQVAYGNQFRPTVQNTPIGPIVRNAWYDFVYHIRWSAGGEGFIDAWVNGERKMQYRGPTLYPGQGCYLKLANYHTPFGKPSAVIHGRVIRGASAAAVSPTPLQ